MVFEFAPDAAFNFVTSFAKKLGVPVVNDSLTIPAALGKGVIKKTDLGNDFKLLIHQYQLKQDFILRRLAPDTSHDIITIILNSNETPAEHAPDGQSQVQFSRNNASAIHVSSNNFEATTTFPANTEIYFTVIGLRAELLSSLLNIARPNALIETILKPGSSFLYYESLTPELQKLLKQITHVNDTDDLSALYYRIKVQEILYLVFGKLLHREAMPQSPVNKADIDTLMTIRSTILADLSVPPHLPELAVMAGMSESKMKQLFRQIFGDSIYNYFQQARMEEAADLIKHQHLSVSEAGYQLGFSNLSHFSRLFERHHGIKPKKYAIGG